MIVLDSNVISALIHPSPDKSVLEWTAQQNIAQLYLTAVTEGEILYGIMKLPAGKKRQRLEKSATQLFDHVFVKRILPFDSNAAKEFGILYAKEKQGGRNQGTTDIQIAAITLAHHATLATRNIKDFKQCGIKLVNPWKG
jgi:toxin FitB